MKWNNVYIPLMSSKAMAKGPIRFNTRYGTVWHDLYPDDPLKAEQLSRLSRELISLETMIKERKIPKRLICEYLGMSREELNSHLHINMYADMNYDDACDKIIKLNGDIMGMISIGI